MPSFGATTLQAAFTDGYSGNRYSTIRTARSRTSEGKFLGILTIFFKKDSGIKAGTVQGVFEQSWTIGKVRLTL